MMLQRGNGMNNNAVKKLLWVLLVLVLALTVTAACGGGGEGAGPAPPPGEGFLPTPPPGGPTAGDPEEITPFRLGSFTLPGGVPYGDLRGVAIGSRYVYVAEMNAVHAFDLNGNYVNTVPIGFTTVQSIGVIPPDPFPEDGDDTFYPYPDYPVVAVDPFVISQAGGEWGGATIIYAPNLDDVVTREDREEADILKFYPIPRIQDYWRYRIFPCTPMPDSPQGLEIQKTFDMDVTREGGIAVFYDFDITTDGGLENCLVFYDPHERYLISPRPTGEINIPDAQGNPQMFPAPFRHWSYGDQTGSMSKIAFANRYPQSRTENQRIYLGDAIMEVDFVGVNTLFTDTTLAPFKYSIGGIIDNAYGFNRIIGIPGGALPGSFAINPPYGPDGGLEDEDLTAGGPSGFGIDPRNDDVYICDPGNRRVQVFTKDLQFKSQIGDGFRGTSGNHLVAPGDVTVSLDGTIFVTDTLGGGVGWLRVFGEPVPPEFGSVGGTVRNMGTEPPTAISEATVSILDANGLVDIQATNIRGEYRFENLPLATYFLTAGKLGYSTDSTSVDLVADRTVLADFNLYPHLPPTLGYYVGAVYDDATNQAIPEVTVHLIGTSIAAITNVYGRFQIDDIPPGDYQVEFIHENYIILTRDLHIVAGQTTRHDSIRLTRKPYG